MFISRRFVAALCIAAALLPPLPAALAEDEGAPKKAPAKSLQSGTAKKPSPSPTPKKSPSTAAPARKPAAASGETPAKKSAAGSKDAPAKKPAASPNESPAKKTSASDDNAAPSKKKGKKSKAKPKPATQKRKSSTESEPAKRRPEPEPEKKTEPTPAPPTPSNPQPSRTSGVTPAATPRPMPPLAPESDHSVIVSKSGTVMEEEEPAPEQESQTRWWWPFGGKRYKYLSRSVREAIDDAHVARHRWRYLVVHNSGTRQGNAKAFDYYHRRVRKMPNGLAYHFVIGNGTSSGNGAIEIGPRWARQINGGHVHSDYLNSIALGICLVGDYNREKPTREQLEALDELIRYLRKRVGKTDHKLAIVKPHRDINPPQWPTDCPGDRFPYNWLNSKFEE